MIFDSLLNNGHFLFIFFHSFAISTKTNKFPKIPINFFQIKTQSPFSHFLQMLLFPFRHTSNSEQSSATPAGTSCSSPSQVPAVSSTRSRPPSPPTRFQRLNASEPPRRSFRHRTSECGVPVTNLGINQAKRNIIFWDIFSF